MMKILGRFFSGADTDEEPVDDEHDTASKLVRLDESRKEKIQAVKNLRTKTMELRATAPNSEEGEPVTGEVALG